MIIAKKNRNQIKLINFIHQSQIMLKKIWYLKQIITTLLYVILNRGTSCLIFFCNQLNDSLRINSSSTFYL